MKPIIMHAATRKKLNTALMLRETRKGAETAVMPLSQPSKVRCEPFCEEPLRLHPQITASAARADSI